MEPTILIGRREIGFHQQPYFIAADIVVNCNLYGEATGYPQNKTYLLGPQYAPLRKQFRKLAPRTARERAEQFLFSTGGTDQYHVALR